MKPSEKYQSLMNQPGFVIDSAQQHSILLLDDLFARVTRVEPTNWWRGLLPGGVKASNTRGIYFWGGVGRGKTLLMDIFFQSLPQQVRRERTHFHSFMNRIHASLQTLGNIENPLDRVARDHHGNFLQFDTFAGRS